jgi:glycosyltransferase involved in cell wall biosynthesis
VVVPVFNEEENARPLVRGIVEAIRPTKLPSELIIVDDGSTDRTVAALRELLPDIPELVVIRLSQNFGQTQALQAGFDRARGDVIVTMDGDLQNDPRDIPRMLEELARGADVVSGWRKDRQDTLVVRKIPSWVANRLIRLVTGVTIHDQGCSLKAYRREVVRGLDLYADMHRFIGVLTMSLGTSVAEIEVRHHPRTAGISKYGLSRIFKVVADLFTIQMLTWFRESPLRWFALLGSPFLIAAGVSTILAFSMASGFVVMPAVAFLSATSFVSCLLCGLLGEAIIEAAGAGRAHRVALREWGEEE